MVPHQAEVGDAGVQSADGGSTAGQYIREAQSALLVVDP